MRLRTISVYSWCMHADEEAKDVEKVPTNLVEEVMSTRKAKQNVKEGLQSMEGMVDSLIEKHLNAPKKPANKIGLAIGFCVHFLILAFTIVIVWTAKPSSSLFSWHPTLMTLAFVVFMPEAILLFSPWSSPFTAPYSSKVRWHWLLQAGMAISALTGFIIITANKIINGYPHYTSWHGALGLYLLVALTFQLSGGVLHMYPEILPFKIRRVTMKRMHATFGTVMFIGGLGVVCLGLYSSWFVAQVEGNNVWHFCVGCVLVTGLYTLVQVLRNYAWR